MFYCNSCPINKIIIDEKTNDQIGVSAQHDISIAGSSQTAVGLDVSGKMWNELPLPIGCINTFNNSNDSTVHET